jgi:Skp family chaperone for outer membrane proteins
VVLFGVALYLQGCAIGYDSTLFVTQSNVGLNVGTKPPIFEMSIARREGVIAPGFEGGQTPPVMASFRTDSNPFSRFFFGVKSTFAGGDAAVALSTGSDDSSVLCLSQPPDKRKILWRDVSVPEKGVVEPFLFGTDTTFGLKVTWGTSGEIPDSARLGFNRTEFAWAPIFGTDVVEKGKCPGIEKPYAVWMPPFLAVLDNGVQTGTPAETGVMWLQYFATGQSATNIALVPGVREVMLRRLDPAAAAAVLQKKITDLNEQAQALQKKAVSLIAGLNADKLSKAYDLAVSSRLADKNDKFPSSEKEQRQFLTERAKAGNKKEEVDNLQNFVNEIQKL